MRLRRKKRPIKKGAPKWMATYSDMVTLVLVFFVLLFSMSQIDAQKFRAISEAFRNDSIFEGMPSVMSSDKLEQVDKSREHKDIESEQDTLDDLYEEVISFLNRNELNEHISATRTSEGVELVLQENILFNTGEAEILDSAKPFLDRVGTLLTTLSNKVRVEGHTDNRPISSYRYPSNWELSGARASSVIRYIMSAESLDSSRFMAAGYSDTQPLVPNNSRENWSKNRRVEIIILEKGKQEAT
ncbi:flagellar motor protein MotS [Gracilibacillus sp. YIM 98692]|uniref:flagellar motor protein MotS n=1 Tax=Gracilibacillus sp. YIM 98692 TaxID=2663532 RepID=UPI0013D42F3E|nr:flagellar motor protein MotS [Gracilibacillus sp. YIM 98692]